MNDLAAMAGFGLLLVRPGMLVAVAPTLGGTYVPAHVKVALTVLLAIGVLPSVVVPAAANNLALTTIVAREMSIGLALGLALRALVGGAELAGHLSGFQIGFSYAATVDPASGVRNSVLTSLYGLLAVLTLLAVNGHHAILRALAASSSGLPIGAGGVDQSLLEGVRHLLALVFTVGVRLAAPVVVVLLIVEIAVGLISRTAPALSFMVIGYPLRLVVGLFVVGVLLSTITGVTGSLVERTIRLALETASAFR